MIENNSFLIVLSLETWKHEFFNKFNKQIIKELKGNNSSFLLSEGIIESLFMDYVYLKSNLDVVELTLNILLITKSYALLLTFVLKIKITTSFSPSLFLLLF